MSDTNRHSLKKRVLRLVTATTLAGSLLSLAMFYSLGSTTMETHGRQTANLLAIQAVNHIRNPIQKELALARKLADTPVLADWARAEDNQELGSRALQALQRYAHHFSGGSVFFIADSSLHYYFLDAKTPLDPAPKYTLDPNKKQDIWYFNTMRHVGDYALNVNYDAVLDTTNVWINTIVRSGPNKVGLTGTGLDLGVFLKEVIDTSAPGVSVVLFDDNGRIQAHRDPFRIAINALRAGNPSYGTMSSLLHDEKSWDLLKSRMTTIRNSPDTPLLPLSTPALSPGGTFSTLIHLPELSWFGIVRVDTSALLNWTDFAPLAVLLIGSLLFTLGALAWILNRVVLSPLSLLTDSVRKVARGHYQPVPITSKDEIGTLASSFNEMSATVREHTENLEHLVRERTEALELSRNGLQARNKEIMDSIEYARTIQQTILPPDGLLNNRLPDHFLIWRPRDIVGGDFYTFIDIPGGWLLAVGDCTGHGVPGAFMSMAAHSALRHAMAEVSPENPGQIIATMNRILQTSLHRDQENPAMDNGLDLGLCIYRDATCTLRFSGARMDLFVFHQETLERIRGTAHSIGYRRSDPDARFAVHDISVDSDTRFYLLTDGITDQSGGEKGFGLGRRRLMKILEEHAHLPLQEQFAPLTRYIATYQGSHPQRDDMTMIGFRPGPLHSKNGAPQ